MTDNIVTVTNLGRQFGNKPALDEVNFEAEKGHIYGLVGLNGAGKTTLIKHLLGLLRCKKGSVQVFGLDPVRQSVEVLGRIGYLSEERELPEWMTVNELMSFTRAYHRNWDMDYAQSLVDTFQLDTGKKIKELSKGMRAQAGLIAAVAHRPDLLILDEPSSGLDAIVRGDILEAIVRTVTDDGRTVIFSSHLLEEVERMSDHITLIHDGRIALDGALDDLQGSHQFSNIRFQDNLDTPPELYNALSITGGGRSWNVIHNVNNQGAFTQDDQATEFQQSLQAHGGEIVESRDATLQEIFFARVGRHQNIVEAA